MASYSYFRLGYRLHVPWLCKEYPILPIALCYHEIYFLSSNTSWTNLNVVDSKLSSIRCGSRAVGFDWRWFASWLGKATWLSTQHLEKLLLILPLLQILYLSGIYTRTELGLRIGIFFTAASLSGAFGGELSSTYFKQFDHDKRYWQLRQ